MEERIQKIMAAAGIASRRAAEEIILEGRVRVNGQVVSELGAKADPDKDHIKVDGKLINPKQPKTYIMLNKPAGCVTTLSDPEGRPTVMELLKGVRVRVYPVGRLDYDTEGLLLLTNDGDFAFRVTHPSHELAKTYQVKIKGVLEDRQIEALEQGVFLKDGKTAPAKVKKLRKEESNSWIEITIHEGRKRQVRRMIDHTGRSVIKLKRVRVGNLSLGDLPLGSFRHLTPDEVKAVLEMAQGGDGFRTGEALKASRRPAAAGHVPEFIDGPKPKARILKKAPSRGADAGSFPRRSERGGPRRPEGRERTFGKKTGWSRQQGDQRERQGSGRSEQRFAKPLVAGSGRPFRSRGPRAEEGFGSRATAGGPFGSRPDDRERGGRRPPRRGGGQDERRSGKPYFHGPDRPFRPSHGPRGAGPDAGARRPAGVTGRRRDEQTRGAAPFRDDRGSRMKGSGQGFGGRTGNRSGAGPRPAGRSSGQPKGPGRRRS